MYDPNENYYNAIEGNWGSDPISNQTEPISFWDKVFNSKSILGFGTALGGSTGNIDTELSPFNLGLAYAPEGVDPTPRQESFVNSLIGSSNMLMLLLMMSLLNNNKEE